MIYAIIFYYLKKLKGSSINFNNEKMTTIITSEKLVKFYNLYSISISSILSYLFE